MARPLVHSGSGGSGGMSGITGLHSSYRPEGQLSFAEDYDSYDLAEDASDHGSFQVRALKFKIICHSFGFNICKARRKVIASSVLMQQLLLASTPATSPTRAPPSEASGFNESLLNSRATAM